MLCKNAQNVQDIPCPRGRVLGTTLVFIACEESWEFNMADHMEQDDANEDSLPGIGDLKTFSQVIRDRVSLGFIVQLSIVSFLFEVIKRDVCILRPILAVF